MSRVKINSVVAYNVDTHEVYVLNDLFHYNDGFKGATGATLMPLTQEYIDYCSTDEYGLEYLDGCGILKDEFDDELRYSLRYKAECEWEAPDVDERAQTLCEEHGDVWWDNDDDDLIAHYVKMAQEQIEDEKQTFIDEYIDDNIGGLVDEKNKEILYGFVNNTGGMFIGHDDSYVSAVTSENIEFLNSKFQMEIESFECVGCGRMWYKDMFQNPNIVWLDEELKREIQIYEDYISADE